MTYEQAYKILTEHTRNYIPLCDSEALEKAIQAVELAKNELIVGEAHWYINPDGWYPQCTNCLEEPRSGELEKHCPNCGYKMSRETK